jgi:hypothetical protein
MAIGKSLRFEVFARDGFTCQYCGQRPPDVLLECDHIHPRSKGGSDDSLNLITSCVACNRGKRAIVISEVAPRPDADIAMLKLQQEGAEIERYLKAKKKRDKLVKQACDALRDIWWRYLTEAAPADRTLIPWIDRYGAEEIEKSIVIAVPSFGNGRFGSNDKQAFHALIPFVAAILRNRARDRADEAAG